MGHYLECFGTLWDIFHANRFFSSLGQFPGLYFPFWDTFVPIFVQKDFVFLPQESEAFFYLNFGCFLPTPTPGIPINTSYVVRKASLKDNTIFYFFINSFVVSLKNLRNNTCNVKSS